MRPNPEGFLPFLVVLSIALTGTATLAGEPITFQASYPAPDNQGDQVRAIRIPINITLRSWHERPFGMRLRLAGTFAANDINDILDGGIDEVRMNSFVPGLEFVIPVGSDHLLRPHLDAGIGVETTTDKNTFLASIGLRTEFVFAGKHYFAGLEPGFRLNNHSGVDLEGNPVFSPFLIVSGRRILGFTMTGHQPDAGIFLEAGYDFNALELASVRSSRDAVYTNWEVGAGFGFSQSQPKIGPFRVPRIRVGYRFGDLEGWRIRIGGDWLNNVAGLSHPGSSS